jgi:hypothetical protein
MFNAYCTGNVKGKKKKIGGKNVQNSLFEKKNTLDV